MSGLFPHKVVDQKEGFVFIVAAADDTDEESVAAAGAAEEILNETWAEAAPSGLTPAECRDPEEAELVYADAVQLLEEADCDEAHQLLITGIVVVGDLVVVNCMLAGEDVEDDDEEEDDDSVEADEEEFE
ncbi:MAG: hypothetical protein RR672_01015 [Raoultibacter sp.]